MVRYDYNTYADHPMFGKYTPSKDIIHYEYWFRNGSFGGDTTNVNQCWWHMYYTRRDYRNLPSDENLYDLQRIFYGGSSTDALWALNNEIILDIYKDYN